MARGDNNKRNTSGSGSSNQSNQGFIKSDKNHKANRNKNQTGVWPSDPQEPQLNADVDRNSGEPARELKSFHTDEKNFNILVDNVPYMIRSVPFTFNGEIRYRVSFNGSPEYVFTWDSSLGQLRAINDDSADLPDNLEMAISEKLQSKG
jgi:hypothetical protein